MEIEYDIELEAESEDVGGDEEGAEDELNKLEVENVSLV